jgi:hypothetical protein
MERGKISAITIIALLSILIFSGVIEHQNSIELENSRYFLKVDAEIAGITQGSCGNMSRVIILNISVEAYLPKDENSILLSFRSSGVGAFYAFLPSSIQVHNAEPWDENYNGGMITQAWSPRTIYNGFSTTGNRVIVEEKIIIRVLNVSQNNFRIIARVLGDNGLSDELNISLNSTFEH